MSFFQFVREKYFPVSVQNNWVKWSFVVCITILWVGSVFSGYSDDGWHWKTVVNATGGLAWKLLMFTIFVSLFCKIFPRVMWLKKILPFRKYTGIFAFLIAVFHGFAQFIRIGVESDPVGMFHFVSQDISMIFGTIGILAMLLPFLTSTLWAVRVMGPKVWKNIQRLTHFAFLFTVLHLLFLEYKNHQVLDWGALVPLVIYVCGYGYIFWKRKNA